MLPNLTRPHTFFWIFCLIVNYIRRFVRSCNIRSMRASPTRCLHTKSTHTWLSILVENNDPPITVNSNYAVRIMVKGIPVDVDAGCGAAETLNRGSRTHIRLLFKPPLSSVLDNAVLRNCFDVYSVAMLNMSEQFRLAGASIPLSLSFIPFDLIATRTIRSVSVRFVSDEQNPQQKFSERKFWTR